MNIEKYKTGIKIKKSNRGKFTSYCGGEVTSACILRGKNSSNPAVRKRATFAANARKWKHQYGGVLLNDATRVAPFYGTSLSLHPEFQEISNNYINSIGHLAYGVLRFLPYTRWATDALDVSGLSPDIQEPDYTDVTQAAGHAGRGWSKNMKSHYENLRVGSRIKVGPRKNHPRMTITLDYKNFGSGAWDKVGTGFKHLGLIGLFGDIKLEILNYNDVVKFKLQYDDKLDSIRFYNRPPLLTLLRHLYGGIIEAKQDNTRVVKPFNLPPIKVVRLPKLAYFSSVSQDEMNRRLRVSEQNKHDEFLYKNLHMWAIDPTRLITRQNVQYEFNNAGRVGEPIRLGMALATGIGALRLVPKAGKFLYNGAKNELGMLKLSVTTPQGRYIWGQTAKNFGEALANPKQWNIGNSFVGNTSFLMFKGGIYGDIGGELFLGLQGKPLDGSMTPEEQKQADITSKDSIDTWFEDLDPNAYYTIE